MAVDGVYIYYSTKKILQEVQSAPIPEKEEKDTKV